ncbi:MAG: zinc-ribbon domain-containing protein [candidate division NC10 bacterium]|nr:zinc-ribbon domain-containing protein [candidate division NC10 bacterium]
MTRITITCPACGRSGAVDERAVPDRPMRLKCPQCQGTFTFTKGTGVPPTASGTSAAPAAPQRARVPPPKPGGGRPASAPTAKAPPPARDRRKLLVAMGALAGGAIILVASSIYAFKLAPIAAEKLLIAALFSRVPPVQRVAIKALRDHPTKHAAIALVAFINLKNLQQVEDPKKPWTPEEKARRRERRVRDLALAERATETLCLLTGQSFGTYFKREPYGYSWGSLREDKWPTVLQQVDAWVLQTFGTGDLPLFNLGLPGALPQPAETAGGGTAR